MIQRLRLGHTIVTYIHLLRGKDPPIYEDCGVLLSVPHLLVEYPNFERIREECGLNGPLLTILSTPEMFVKVIQFLNLTNLYFKIYNSAYYENL